MNKNFMSDVFPLSERFDFIYRGVVEDNKDPAGMGRCKIRIIGLHTPVKEKTATEGIPTDELPWAYQVSGVFGGGSGFGSWGVPLQGTHVFVFFENGNIMQPRYFGISPGIPDEYVAQPPLAYPGRSSEGEQLPADMKPPVGVENPGPIPKDMTDVVVTITRTDTNLQGTCGKLTSTSGFSCYTLELPWKENRNGVSCIPPGEYVCSKQGTPKFPNNFGVKNVRGRAGIVIHSGTFAGSKSDGYDSNVEGCILLGSGIQQLQSRRTGKVQKAIINSKTTVQSFNNHLQLKPFTLKVIDNTGTMG